MAINDKFPPWWDFVMVVICWVTKNLKKMEKMMIMKMKVGVEDNYLVMKVIQP